VDIRRGHFVETAEPRADGVVLEGRNGGRQTRARATGGTSHRSGLMELAEPGVCWKL
jgi:hypothetical protein